MARCPLPPPPFCGSAARFVVGGANHLLSVAKASLHVAPSLFGHQKFEREADLGRDLRQLNNFSAASGATQSTRNNKVKQLVNGAVQGVAYGHSRLLRATARSLRGRSGRRRLALVLFRRGHARHFLEVFFGVDDASAEVPPRRTRAALIDEVSAEGGELFLHVVVVLLDVRHVALLDVVVVQLPLLLCEELVDRHELLLVLGDGEIPLRVADEVSGPLGLQPARTRARIHKYLVLCYSAFRAVSFFFYSLSGSGSLLSRSLALSLSSLFLPRREDRPLCSSRLRGGSECASVRPRSLLFCLSGCLLPLSFSLWLRLSSGLLVVFVRLRSTTAHRRTYTHTTSFRLSLWFSAILPLGLSLLSPSLSGSGSVLSLSVWLFSSPFSFSLGEKTGRSAARGCVVAPNVLSFSLWLFSSPLSFSLGEKTGRSAARGCVVAPNARPYVLVLCYSASRAVFYLCLSLSGSGSLFSLRLFSSPLSFSLGLSVSFSLATGFLIVFMRGRSTTAPLRRRMTFLPSMVTSFLPFLMAHMMRLILYSRFGWNSAKSGGCAARKASRRRGTFVIVVILACRLLPLVGRVIVAVGFVGGESFEGGAIEAARESPVVVVVAAVGVGEHGGVHVGVLLLHLEEVDEEATEQSEAQEDGLLDLGVRQPIVLRGARLDGGVELLRRDAHDDVHDEGGWFVTNSLEKSMRGVFFLSYFQRIRHKAFTFIVDMQDLEAAGGHGSTPLDGHSSA